MADPDPSLPPEADIPRLRSVYRAVAELRRGAPVLLRGADGRPGAVMIAAEAAGAVGLREFAPLAMAPPVLILGAMRAAALLRRPLASFSAAMPAPAGPVALAFRTGSVLDPATLRGLADPTAAQLIQDPPTPARLPPLATAAFTLVKCARLLPAALISPVDPSLDTTPLSLLSAAAAEILGHADAEAAALVQVAEAAVPLEDAPDARLIAFRAPDAGIEHLAIVIGQPDRVEAPLVRLHSECFTGDLLGSLRCDCGPQLRAALARITAEGAGVVLYLAQEGRGIGLASKLRAYEMQDRGLDTLDANRALGWHADERNFLVAATMLRSLGLPRIRLLSNNPDKLAALAASGIEIAGREKLVIPPNGVNDDYLATKARRFGHLLE